MELNPSARNFLQNKVDELLDLFTNTTSRVTPEFADEVLATTTPVVSQSAPVERLLRRDMDPDRSIFSQRVERQIANTGMSEEEAQQAILDRRAARAERLANLQEELGLDRRKARGVLRYGNRKNATNQGEGGNEPNYKRANRVIQMSRRKGLKRAEAASILNSRAATRKEKNKS